jgi:GTP-binding protein Era
MRSGFIAVAGRPNVGKSTLVNALCGAKVAIVSDKPQTTRHRIQGVANGQGWQLVLVDLPGFQRPRDALTAHMQRTAEESLAGVDGVLLVLAADERIGPGDRFVAARAFATGAPVVIALNKVDRLGPAEIARQIEAAAALGDFRALHSVSAKTGSGLAALRDELVELLPEGPAYFPPGEQSSMPVELRLAELVREKALELTREEVPHAVTVEVEEITERCVRASILVETSSQKQILIGKGGMMIREIGTRARPEIEALLGRHVYLDLRVKVRERWRRDEALLARLGI